MRNVHAGSRWDDDDDDDDDHDDDEDGDDDGIHDEVGDDGDFVLTFVSSLCLSFPGFCPSFRGSVWRIEPKIKAPFAF